MWNNFAVLLKKVLEKISLIPKQNNVYVSVFYIISLIIFIPLILIMIILEITLFLIYKLILKATENMSLNEKITLVIVSGFIIQISYFIRYKSHLTEDFIQTIFGVSLFMILLYYFIKDALNNNRPYCPPYIDKSFNEGINSDIHIGKPRGYKPMPKTYKGRWWKSLTGDGRRSPRKEMIDFYSGKMNGFLKRW